METVGLGQVTYHGVPNVAKCASFVNNFLHRFPIYQIAIYIAGGRTYTQALLGTLHRYREAQGRVTSVSSPSLNGGLIRLIISRTP